MRPKHILALALPGAMTKLGTNVFKKHLLRFGRWIHPADSKQFFTVDEKLVDDLIRNFDNNAYNDFIPVQMAENQDDPHKVKPTDTVGRVVGLIKQSDGLYSLIEFGDAVYTDRADKNLIPGVSAGISLNYLHKEKAEEVGPVLKHVVLCNEPYIKNLRGFEKVQLSEQGKPETDFNVIEFSESTNMNRQKLEALAKKLGIDPTKFQADEALLAEVERVTDANSVQLSEVKDVDVKDLKAKAAQHDTLLAENTTLKSQVETLKKEKPDNSKVVELSDKVTALSTKVDALTTENQNLKLSEKTNKVTGVVDGLIREGKVLPAQKDRYVKLGTENEALFAEMTKDMPVIVQLGERGVSSGSSPIDTKLSETQTKEHIDRYAVMLGGKADKK